ncbi:MAG: ECF transporter S component [Alistipes sp.]|nr:ECF transporter S component [Alistipes sp.]
MKAKLNIKSMVIMGLLMAIVLVFCMTPIGSIPIGPLVITLNVIPVAIAAVAVGPIGGLVVGTFFGLFSFLQCLEIGVPSGMGMILFQISPVMTFIQRVVPRALDGLLVGLIYRGVTKVRSKKAYYGIAAAISALFGAALFLSIMQLVGYDKNAANKMTPALDSFMKSGSLLVYVIIAVAVLCFAIGYMLVSGKKLKKMNVACMITGFSTAILNTLFFMSALILLFGNTEYVKNLMNDTVGSENAVLFIIVFVGVNALVEMVLATIVTGAVGAALHKAKLVKGPEEDK